VRQRLLERTDAAPISILSFFNPQGTNATPVV
jgi:hypothetical protein